MALCDRSIIIHQTGPCEGSASAFALQANHLEVGTEAGPSVLRQLCKRSTFESELRNLIIECTAEMEAP